MLDRRKFPSALGLVLMFPATLEQSLARAARSIEANVSTRIHKSI
jgi:hypothetical protein